MKQKGEETVERVNGTALKNNFFLWNTTHECKMDIFLLKYNIEVASW